MNQGALEEMYTAYLRTEGYRPDLEKNGTVAFTKDGHLYVIIVTDDAELFDLRARVWTLPSDADRARARKALLAVMANTKVTKLYFYEDQVWMALQLLCDPPESFKQVFGRCLTLLETTRDRVLASLKE